MKREGRDGGGGGSRSWRRRLRSPSRDDLVLLSYWVALLLLLLGFAELGGDIYERDRIDFDSGLLVWLGRHQTPFATRVARALDLIGNPYVSAPLVLLLGGLLWRARRRSSVFFVLAVGGAGALNVAAKAFFERARPEIAEALSAATNYAFPSGHTMIATAVATAVFLLVREHAPAWQGPAAVAGAAYALVAGAARAYLQVHYPSDVLAGWALAAAWVMGVNLWYGRSRRHQRRHRRRAAEHRVRGRAEGPRT